jgi:hypothetical protein
MNQSSERPILPGSRPARLGLGALVAVAVLAVALLNGPLRPAGGAAPAPVAVPQTGQSAPGGDADPGVGAEAYVQAPAFQPGSNSLVFLTDPQFPHGRALFALAADPASGQLAPTATVASALPDGILDFVDVKTAGPHTFLAGTLSDAQADGPDRNIGLWLADPEGGPARELVSPDRGLMSMAPLPDGTAVLATDRAGRLFAVDAGTGALRELGEGLVSYAGNGGADPVLSPDGQQAAVVLNPEQGRTQILLIELADGSRRELVALDGPDGDLALSNPVFSADGLALLYAQSLGEPPSTGAGPGYRVSLMRLGTAPGSQPELVADLTAQTGHRQVRVSALHRVPGTDDLVFRHASQLYRFRPATGQAEALTGPHERVGGGLALAKVGAETWLAYTVQQPLGASQTAYLDKAGQPLADGSFGRLMLLP